MIQISINNLIVSSQQSVDGGRNAYGSNAPESAVCGLLRVNKNMFLKIYRYKNTSIKDWYIAQGRDKKGRYLHGFGRTHYEALKNALKK